MSRGALPAIRRFVARLRRRLRGPALPAARPWSRGAGPRTLFVSETEGAPMRYRVLHQAEQLAVAGVASAWCHAADPRVVRMAAEADLLYLYRVEDGPHARGVVAAARARGAPVVFDTDDLIWDDRLVEYCDLERYYSPGEVDGFRGHFARAAAVMAEADAFVASTDYLAGLIRERFGRPTFANQNAVSREAVARSAALPPRVTGQPLTVAYFSGWPNTHEADLAVALPGVARALAELPGARLRIVGHLSPEAIPEALRGQVELAPFVPYEQLFAAIAEADISLAPLVDNPHRRSKSAVKFLEAALAGVPTVASDMEPYRLIEHGTTGFLAAGEEGWRDAVLALGRSPALRSSIGAAARAQVLAGHTTDVRAPGYAAMLRGIIGGARDRL